jgi:hypothetical protein
MDIINRIFIKFGHIPEMFWYRSRICLVDNRLFHFGIESVLLDKIEMISFNVADSGFLLDVGTFVKSLWNICSFTVLTLLLGMQCTI